MDDDKKHIAKGDSSASGKAAEDDKSNTVGKDKSIAVDKGMGKAISTETAKGPPPTSYFEGESECFMCLWKQHHMKPLCPISRDRPHSA